MAEILTRVKTAEKRQIDTLLATIDQLNAQVRGAVEMLATIYDTVGQQYDPRRGCFVKVTEAEADEGDAVES